MTSAPLTRSGVDHADAARRSRAVGWWFFAEGRLRRELPFLGVTLATAFGNPVLYLVAMGIGLGALVQQPVDGVSYLHFVAPGLVVSTVATTGAGWGTWPIMGGFKWERTYLAAGATAISPVQVALGELVALGLRLLAQAAVFWAIGLAFGAWGLASAWWVIPIATAAGLAFFAPLAAYSATLEDEGLQFNFINRLIVMPMFLFAGTFFPLTAMPPFLQWIGWISPMWHGTQLARIASYGMANEPLLTLGHVAFLVACVVGGMAVAARTFSRRMEKAS